MNRDEIDRLYSFARIHSWCDQLNEQIDSLLASLSKEDGNELLAYINTAYWDKESIGSHLVLSFVLKARLGTDELELMSSAYEKLRGRLEKSDQYFLADHLFNGYLPFSDEVGNGMLFRSYLSYKRAIYQAMQVDSLLSHFPAAKTSLYLTIILCRVDLNEQNRALLCFLLSKIDAPLPEALLQGIFRYLLALKGVITELLERGEEALADSFSYADEPDFRQESASSKAAPKPPVSPSGKERGRQEENAAGVIEKQNSSPREPASSSDDVQSVSDSPDERMTKSESQQQRGENGLLAPLDLQDARDETGESVDKKLGSGETEALSPASLNGDKQASKLSGHEAVGDGAGSGLDESGEGEPVPAEEPEGREEEETNYTVYFNRNSDLLDRLLHEVAETAPPKGEEEEKAPITLEAPEDSSRDEDEIKARTKAVVSSSHLRPSSIIAAGVLLFTALLFAVLFFSGERKRPGPEAMQQPLESVGMPAASTASAEGAPDKSAPELKDEATLEPELEQEADSFPAPELPNSSSPYTLEFRSGRMLWQVGKGDSLWALFQFYQGRDAGVRISGSVNWALFLQASLEQNPELGQLELIFPQQRLFLPQGLFSGVP